MPSTRRREERSPRPLPPGRDAQHAARARGRGDDAPPDAAPTDAPTDAPPGAPATLLARLRDGGRPLLLLLGLALLLKLVIVLAAQAEDPLARWPASDAAYYLDRARGIAGITDDPLAAQSWHLPPLYPWILAALPGVVHGDLVVAGLVQALGGTLLLALVYALARRRLSRTASLLAVGLTLLYGPLSYYETRLLGDSLACLAFIAALVAADALADALAGGRVDAHADATRNGEPGAALRAATLGALVALAALLRPQALLLLPVLLFWMLRLAPRSRRAGLAFVAAAGLLLAPSALHNLRTSGDLILVSDNGGVNLWLANTGPVSGTFATDEEAFGDIEHQAEVARTLAERDEGRALSAGEVSSHFTRAALAAIAGDPGRFVHRVALRARALAESFETDIASFPETGRALIAPLKLLALPFGLLVGLCVGSALLGARGRAAPCRAAPRLPMLALAGMIVLTALLFFHYSRFRLPLVPLLAIGAAAAWDRLRAGPVPTARALGALGAAALVTGLSYLPAPHHAPTLANGLTSTGQARLALSTSRDERIAQAALADAQAALQAQPGFVRALLLKARTELLLGRWTDCRDTLDAVERAAPGLPEARVQRAFLLAVPAGSNPLHDPAAAAAIVAELAPLAASDPELANSLDGVRSLLGR